MENFDRLSEVYAHYTWSGLTEEELNRADYVAAMDLLEQTIPEQIGLDAWTLNGNEMTVSVHSGTLEEINQLAQTLDADALTDYCSVTATATAGAGTGDETVTATLLIYFKGAERGSGG